MTDLNNNTFSSFNIFPKYVIDETLKRARIEQGDLASIRVTTTNPETPGADLTTLENNTNAIKNTDNAINSKIGNKSDDAWDGEHDASLIEIGKKQSIDTTNIMASIGTTSDSDAYNTVIGLLKSIIHSFD